MGAVKPNSTLSTFFQGQLQNFVNPFTLCVRTFKESVGIVPATRKESERPLNDASLIRRIADGDDTALAILYDRYAGIVYSVAVRILNDVGAAEEILQDIFHQLWRTASNFDSARGTLPGWLLVTARNRAIDRLRRRRPGDGGTIQENLIPFSFNLESSVAQNELMARIKAVVAEMPGPQRQALELAYFEGLTHSEIAQRTGEPLGTIKTRLRTGLQTLKRVFSTSAGNS